MNLFLVYPLTIVCLIEVRFISWYKLANLCERIYNRNGILYIREKKNGDEWAVRIYLISS